MKKTKKSKVTKLNSSARQRKERRYFSESARRSIVKDWDDGLMSTSEISKLYKVSTTAVYKWLEKYSPLYQKRLVKVIEHQSQSQRIKKLEKETSQVYEKLGRVQLELEFYKELIKLSEEGLGIDLKKNFEKKLSKTFPNKSVNR